MRHRRWLIIVAGVALVVMVTCVSTTGAYFGDGEGSTPNGFDAWMSTLWRQTSQADFNAGVLSQVETSSSPGDVKLGKTAAPASVVDTFVDESKIASKTNLVVAGGHVELTSSSSGGTETLRPWGEGSYAQCDPYGAAANWQTVDEAVSDGDTSYVQTTYGATELDTYHLENHLVGSGTITSVTAYIRSKISASGTGSARVAIRTNNNNYYGTSTALSTSYTTISKTWTKNPFTNNDWNWTEIDGLQAGVQQADTDFTPNPRTTQVWVEVNYAGSIVYNSPGTLTSVNLLSGQTVASITSFRYNVSSIPAGTTLKVRFSQNGSTWYNSSGTAGGWDTLSQGSNIISLAALGWSGANFYYQAEFTSTGASTPVLDEVEVYFGSVADTFADESKIASKTNVVVAGGQVKLTSSSSGGTETLRPWGEGSFTQCDPFGAAANWQTVDEAVSDGDTTYVQTSGDVTEVDTYHLENHLVGSGTITSVTVYVRTRSTVAGGAAEVAIRTNNNNYYESYTVLSTAYTTISKTWTKNPSTTNDWTWAEVDGLEAGVRQIDQTTGYNRTTQVWVEVSYAGSPVYNSPGTLTSVNLLSGQTVASITSFRYNVSSIPAGTTLKVRFSQNGSTWYNSSGTAGGWDTLSQGSNIISLSALGWSGANFYYQAEFTSTGASTPVLDEIGVFFAREVYYTSGTVASDVLDTGVSAAQMNTLCWDRTLPGGTMITFEVRAAEAPFAKDAGSPSWVEVVGDSPVRSGLQAGRYMQWRATLSTGDLAQTPVLHEVRLYWDQ